MKSFVDFITEDPEDILRIVRGDEEIPLRPDPMRRPKRKEAKKDDKKKDDEPQAGPLRVTVDPRLRGSYEPPIDYTEVDKADKKRQKERENRRMRITRNLGLDPAAQKALRDVPYLSDKFEDDDDFAELFTSSPQFRDHFTSLDLDKFSTKDKETKDNTRSVGSKENYKNPIENPMTVDAWREWHLHRQGMVMSEVEQINDFLERSPDDPNRQLYMDRMGELLDILKNYYNPDLEDPTNTPVNRNFGFKWDGSHEEYSDRYPRKPLDSVVTKYQLEPGQDSFLRDPESFQKYYKLMSRLFQDQGGQFLDRDEDVTEETIDKVLQQHLRLGMLRGGRGENWKNDADPNDENRFEHNGKMYNTYEWKQYMSGFDWYEDMMEKLPPGTDLADIELIDALFPVDPDKVVGHKETLEQFEDILPRMTPQLRDIIVNHRGVFDNFAGEYDGSRFLKFLTDHAEEDGFLDALATPNEAGELINRIVGGMDNDADWDEIEYLEDVEDTNYDSHPLYAALARMQEEQDGGENLLARQALRRMVTNSWVDENLYLGELEDYGLDSSVAETVLTNSIRNAGVDPFDRDAMSRYFDYNITPLDPDRLVQYWDYYEGNPIRDGDYTLHDFMYYYDDTTTWTDIENAFEDLVARADELGSSYNDQNREEGEDDEDDDDDDGSGWSANLLWGESPLDTDSSALDRLKRRGVERVAGKAERAAQNAPEAVRQSPQAQAAYGAIQSKERETRPRDEDGTPNGSSRKSFKDDYTTFNTTIHNNPNQFGTHRYETLDRDLKRAGLKRTDLQKSMYIAWSAYGNKTEEDMKRKYEQKTGKKAEGDEYIQFKKKAAALNAVRNWRTNVLPSLEPGTILYNTPVSGGAGGNMREVLYSKMGFGEYGHYGQQAVVGKDGKVYPIGPRSQSDLGRRMEIRAGQRAARRPQNESMGEVMYWWSQFPSLSQDDIRDIVNAV